MNLNEIRDKIQLVRTDISLILLSQIFCEVLLFPFLVLFWAGWNRYSRHIPFPKIKKATRKTSEDVHAVICLHDWLGYPGERQKTLKNGIKFSCGRTKILRGLQEHKNKIPTEIFVSLSGHGAYDFDHQSVKKVILTENRGKDFRGYSLMLQEILKLPGNPFVVLMNSSVAGGFYDGWLDDYCSILTNDRSIGLLGISTRARFPGLVKNHLAPHLQSFFLVSTKEVLSKILQLNGGMHFDAATPGQGIDEGTDELNTMIAHLSLAVTEAPEWWNLDDLTDLSVLTSVYKEVISFENSFLGRGKAPQGAGSGGSSQEDSKEAQGEADASGTPQQVVGGQVQASLEP